MRPRVLSFMPWDMRHEGGISIPIAARVDSSLLILGFV